ncbi:hypothetical protein OHS33_30885 [Streptomyces sp. NBC_00536]|uniref:hypothetical protein n=1 Tax=Streptomyces sp. NBC_00536 TaxID=2975769 RepID=UPI002E807988|nr:hypothetical protein [Streptomyces sp. NBC_00536]WUC82370.1 hypothetical protein OHS33_30885 [Streptomyces sp. NBC_00536]
MKHSMKTLVLRKAAIIVAVGCAAASLFSVSVAHHDAPAPGHSVTVLADGKDTNEWNSQG